MVIETENARLGPEPRSSDFKAHEYSITPSTAGLYDLRYNDPKIPYALKSVPT